MANNEIIDKRIDEIKDIKQLKEELKLMWRFINAGIVADPKNQLKGGLNDNTKRRL